MAGKPVYARQDRVMAVQSGTTEALDSQSTISGLLRLKQSLRR
jgi:hypothetical protein